MNIGLLNTRIMLLKNVVTVDAIGNHRNEWTDYFSCYATLGNEAGEETEDAGQVNDKATCSFSVRWCRETSVITSTSYRVRWNSELYDITHIDHMSNKRKILKIWCKKVKR